MAKSNGLNFAPSFKAITKLPFQGNLFAEIAQNGYSNYSLKFILICIAHKNKF